MALSKNEEMIVLVDWLWSVGQLASVLYREASLLFEEDPEFSSFLARIADDESLHAELMDHVADYLQNHDVTIKPAVKLRVSDMEQVERPLQEAHTLAMKKTLTKKQMIAFIAEAERSQWNVILLYVVTTMKNYSKKFQYMAAAIQAHERRISQFLESLPEDLKPEVGLGILPPVWKNKLLVVDDEPGILFILSRMLASQGQIETARDGEEALEKSRKDFFNVIIVDVQMPKMSGLEFFHQAVKEDPDIQTHFLFCTGRATPEEIEYLKENRLPYLLKPVDLDEVKQKVDEILNCAL